jgi:tripartite-type tricarboxylate transporter receptor subunit TctC
MGDDMLKIFSPLAAAGLCLAAATTAASAETPAEFYKGKQLRIIVGGAAGGGYDIYARTFSRYFADQMPGKPTPVVQNMQGAASIRAANYVYNVAPKDGTVIGMVQREIPMLPLYGEATQETLQYETLKFNWIGNLNNETSVCATWHTSPTKMIQDAMKRETIIGGAGANDTEKFPAVLNNMLDTKFKIISGYVGANIDLAIERGEVEGRCGWSWSSLKNQKPDWLRDKKLNILIQLSAEPHEELKDVPFILDFAKSERDKQTLNLIFASLALGRPFVMPPDVPQDRIAAARDAFNKAARDPRLVADLAKQSLDVSPVSGETMQKLLADLMKSPPDIVARAVAAMKK